MAQEGKSSLCCLISPLSCSCLVLGPFKVPNVTGCCVLRQLELILWTRDASFVNSFWVELLLIKPPCIQVEVFALNRLELELGLRGFYVLSVAAYVGSAS